MTLRDSFSWSEYFNSNLINMTCFLNGSRWKSSFKDFKTEISSIFWLKYDLSEFLDSLKIELFALEKSKNMRLGPSVQKSPMHIHSNEALQTWMCYLQVTRVCWPVVPRLIIEFTLGCHVELLLVYQVRHVLDPRHANRREPYISRWETQLEQWENIILFLQLHFFAEFFDYAELDKILKLKNK